MQHFPDHSTKNCTDIVCPLISTRSISCPLKFVALTKEPCPGNLMGNVMRVLEKTLRSIGLDYAVVSLGEFI